MENINLKVPGMSCSHCEKAIKGALAELAGIGTVKIDLDSKDVNIDYDPASTGPDKIKAAIEDQGYDIE